MPVLNMIHSCAMTGNELKECRSNLGLTQATLAQALKKALSTIARWEQFKDKQIPNTEMLELALEALEKKSINGQEAKPH